MAIAWAPASSTRLASSGALISSSSQPLRIFTVTGIFTAFAIAAMIDAACSGSRIRLQPALCLAIFGTGQPMLTSTMLAPICSTTRAASAIFAGSPPKIWIETGRSSSVYSAYSSVRSMPRTRPSLLTISDTTRPQPPCRFTRRRNEVSVMPAIGETTNGDSRVTGPMLVRFDISCVYFNRYGLPDQIHRQDESRVRAFAHQAPHHAFQRPMGDTHHVAFLDERHRVVRQLAFNQRPDALDLFHRNRRQHAVIADDLDDAVDFQD